MARNSEKAVTALARWRNLQLKEQGKKSFVERRPYSVADESDVRRAEKWRNQVIKEVAKKVAQIQNAGLGEFKIRDLNDEINRLLREKTNWEDRIKELGGPDFRKIGPKLLDKEGKEAPGSKGYKYFGAAKDLPGVRELFEAEAAQAARKTRAELLRQIDADYYGYLDDDDNLLVPQETKCEQEARRRKIEEYKLKLQEGGEQAVEMDVETANTEQAQEDDDDDDEYQHFDFRYREEKKKTRQLHVQIPTQEDVAKAILEKKRRELLARYAPTEETEEK